MAEAAEKKRPGGLARVAGQKEGKRKEWAGEKKSARGKNGDLDEYLNYGKWINRMELK